MTYVLPLEKVSANERSLVGGKALGCGKLVAHGLKVPKGIVVTSCAFHKFIRDNQLDQALDQLITLFNTESDIDALTQATVEFRILLKMSSIAVVIKNELQSAIAHLNGKVSVRSSANVEDGSENAFAGVFSSVLNVEKDQVEAQILECWSSAYTYDAITYAMRNSIDPRDCWLGLLIQEMVEADWAGVYFTKEPFAAGAATGGVSSAVTITDKDAVEDSRQDSQKGVLSYVTGLGDALMEGTASATTLVIDTKQPLDKQHCAGELPTSIIQQLIHVGEMLEQVSAQPQDIEWAVKDNTLYFLQVRDITTLGRVDEEELAWTREVSEERFPKAVSPLGWSMLQNVFATNVKTLSERFGFIAKKPTDIARTIDYYVYTSEKFFSIPGSMKVDVKTQLRYLPKLLLTLAKALLYLPLTMRSKSSLGSQWLVLTSMMRVLIFSHAKQILAYWDEHLADTLKKFEALQEVDASQLSDTGLLGMKQLIEENAEVYMEPDLAIYVVKSACELCLEKMIKQVDPDNSELTIKQLTGGVVDNITLRRNAELEDLFAKLNRDKKAVDLLNAGHYEAFLMALSEENRTGFDRFLRQYGHVTSNWDCMEPTWGENPITFLSLIKHYSAAREVKGFRRNQEESIQQYYAAKQRIITALDGNTWMIGFFEELISILHEFMRIDEEQNFHCSKIFIPTRKLFLEIGNRFQQMGVLENVEDVFFLEMEEIVAMLKHGAQFTRRYAVQSRKVAYKRADRKRAPHQYIGNKPVVDAVEQIKRQGNELKGVAASPGVGRGRVCIVASQSDLVRFREGDVIVTVSPVPAWTPLYAVASGLIASTGSTLSHGLISAREYRLPAVIGLPGVVNELKDGQLVVVDGDAGIVVIEDSLHATESGEVSSNEYSSKEAYSKENSEFEESSALVVAATQ